MISPVNIPTRKSHSRMSSSRIEKLNSLGGDVCGGPAAAAAGSSRVNDQSRHAESLKSLMQRLRRVLDAVASPTAAACSRSTSRHTTTTAAAAASTSSAAAAAAAAILARARAPHGSAERQKIGHLPEALQDVASDERGAYAVQSELHQLLARQQPELGVISGTKIGCTTAVMQE
jgi:hypothetical protein